MYKWLYKKFFHRDKQKLDRCISTEEATNKIISKENNQLLQESTRIPQSFEIKSKDDLVFESWIKQHFLNAVIEGNIQSMEWCLNKGVNINASDNNGNSALHLAIIHENRKLIDYLLAKGVDVNARDSNGNTALHIAFLHYCFVIPVTEILDRLLQKNADVNIANNKGETPLHLAVQLGYRKIENIKCLLSSKEKININAVDSQGRTPLYSVFNDGNYDLEIIKVLLQAGAITNINKILNSNGIDISGNSLFLHLIKHILNSLHSWWKPQFDLQKFLKIAELLLIYGASINDKTILDETALILVTRFADRFNFRNFEKLAVLEALTKFLLKAGIDINARDNTSYSAFKTTIPSLSYLIEEKGKQNHVRARRAFLSAGLESEKGIPAYPTLPLYFFFSRDRDHYCTEIILKNAELLPKKYKTLKT